jgi:hypothetical protein
MTVGSEGTASGCRKRAGQGAWGASDGVGCGGVQGGEGARRSKEENRKQCHGMAACGRRGKAAAKRRAGRRQTPNQAFLGWPARAERPPASGGHPGRRTPRRQPGSSYTMPLTNGRPTCSATHTKSPST